VTRRPPLQPESGIYKFIVRIGRPLLYSICRYEWSGGENLPAEGGFIAAANHVSDFDAVTTAHFLIDNGYEPRILAKRTLFTTPVIGAILRGTNMIPVDRGTSDAGRSLDAAAEALASGSCVAIFPEGTLTRDPDLWPMEGKTGVARLALAAKVPVIPIGQWGQTAVLDRYGKILKPWPKKRIQIRVGQPVDLSDLYDREIDGATLREATNRVMDAIGDIVGELRGEQPPSPRFDLRKHPENKKKQRVYKKVERP
jgi:1-acyl-sn-glycerol-3-phosphate acyltransferase